VQLVEPLGSHLLLSGTTEGLSLRVVLPPGGAVRGGETIPLRSNLAHVVWVHAATGEALES
jgi:multiple sugar transport system ATP-binding protein